MPNETRYTFDTATDTELQRLNNAIRAENAVLRGETPTDAEITTPAVNTPLDATLAATTAAIKNHTTAIRNMMSRTIYGFHIDSTESDPEAAVTYLADAVGMTPAHMDFANDRFDYGSWRNAFFMPRPCMLKSDGTVGEYLDPNDYSKKADGTPSDVADTTYDGNAMMEWGRDGKKIWYKIVPDTTDPTSADVFIADYQVDEDYHAWSFYNADGKMVDHFYTPIYNGTIVNNGTYDRLRSISGLSWGTYGCKNKSAATERAAARHNNDEADIWDTEVYADIILINLLLTLIGKSTDGQSVFGNGLSTSGSEAVNDGFTTGIHDKKGLFYGTNSGAAATYTNAVKVFGMENWWGFQWRRFGGLVNVTGTMKYKLTRGTQDGSAASDYVVSTAAGGYAGYLTGDALPTASGTYINKIAWKEDGAYTPTETSGAASTHYCDSLWTDNGQVDYAYLGGISGYGARCGPWCVGLNSAASNAGWNIGAALSCKPLKQEA